MPPSKRLAFTNSPKIPVELGFDCSPMPADSSKDYAPSLSALRQRDEMEWSRFFRHVFHIACQQAYQSICWLKNRDASSGVADIAQESMITFFNRVVEPNSPLVHLKSPVAYLCKIVRWTASGHIQKAFAAKRGGNSFPGSLDQSVSSADDSSSKDLYEFTANLTHSQDE